MAEDNVDVQSYLRRFKQDSHSGVLQLCQGIYYDGRQFSRQDRQFESELCIPTYIYMVYIPSCHLLFSSLLKLYCWPPEISHRFTSHSWVLRVFFTFLCQLHVSDDPEISLTNLSAPSFKVQISRLQGSKKHSPWLCYSHSLTYLSFINAEETSNNLCNLLPTISQASILSLKHSHSVIDY